MLGILKSVIDEWMDGRMNQWTTFQPPLQLIGKG